MLTTILGFEQAAAWAHAQSRPSGATANDLSSPT